VPDGTSDGQQLYWVVNPTEGDSWVAKQPAARNHMPPYLALNYVIALQGLYPSRNAAEPFIGEIMIFAGNFAPRGWAFCDGQLLQIAQNSALFSLLGTTYGGDGRVTFGLPDLRGRAPIHKGSAPGLTPRILGQRGGSETHPGHEP
jgi:microcystin-dependent protein